VFEDEVGDGWREVVVAGAGALAGRQVFAEAAVEGMQITIAVFKAGAGQAQEARQEALWLGAKEPLRADQQGGSHAILRQRGGCRRRVSHGGGGGGGVSVLWHSQGRGGEREEESANERRDKCVSEKKKTKTKRERERR
jgi:hypothetical protein